MANSITPTMTQSYRVLVLALMGAPLLIGLVLYFLIGGSIFDPWTPNVPIMAAFLLVEATVALVGSMMFNMTPALKPGDDGTSADSFMAFQTNSILRFALTEVPLIMALAAAFILTSGGYLLYLMVMVLTEFILLLNVYPTRHNLLRFEAAQEREGGQSNFADCW